MDDTPTTAFQTLSKISWNAGYELHDVGHQLIERLDLDEGRFHATRFRALHQLNDTPSGRIVGAMKPEQARWKRRLPGECIFKGLHQGCVAPAVADDYQSELCTGF